MSLTRLFCLLQVYERNAPELGICAGNNPQALLVFEGNELEPPKQLYLCMSGHVGDVPWTAVVARACGHSSFKGCPRCFQLGVTINGEGESLGCVRCLGYLGEVCTQILRIDSSYPPDQPGHTFWEDGIVCYSAEEDGVQVFNEQGARAIRVTEEQRRKRAEGAAVLMRDCIAQRPLPTRGESECIQTWEERIIFPGSAQLMSSRALMCACGDNSAILSTLRMSISSSDRCESLLHTCCETTSATCYALQATLQE
jgi:hypothetical protein